MEEETKLREQPENIQPSIEEDAVGSPSELQEESNRQVEVETEKGVELGKFKNVEELYKAYNNLQAEFTKKSQKLAEMMKHKVTETPTSAANAEDGFKVFLSKNQEAAFYADELKSRVCEAGSFDEGSFERAWAGLLYEKLSSKGKQNEPIIQNLIKDDEIQNLVIKNYMEQLAHQKTPIVMSSQVGERVTKTATPKPDTFEDAKRVVLDLFS